jgi:hypothetical protein
MRRLLGFLATLLLTVGCGRVATPPAPAPTPAPTPGPGGDNGLTGAERVRWHHLAEGSEVYPLAWLLALEDSQTGKPFLESPERFGLIADPQTGPDNPYGLPIGLTVEVSRDLRFAGVQMVGVNCAACHVNEFHKGGQRVALVDGAPNLFDLAKFYGDLARSTAATFTDVSRAWRFVTRLPRVARSADRPALAAVIPDPARPLLDKATDLGSMRAGGPLEQALAERIEALHREEMKRPAPDLRTGLSVRGADPALDNQVKALQSAKDRLRAVVPPEVRKAATALRRKALAGIDVGPVKELAEKAPRPGGALAELPEPTRALALGESLAFFVETVRLLRARAAFLLGLYGRNDVPQTDPGFGRVDAFGGARNLFFPDHLGPMTAPISYPHLWTLKQTVWLHWDGNTTSVLERNAGQALGLGALFDPTTFDSTLILPHLDELEQLTLKITPPAWPAAFGTIDPAKAGRGAELFKTHCKECHQPLEPGGNTGDLLFELPKIGTDPLRAENFARPSGTEQFNVALSRVLKAVVTKAGGAVSPENQWRITRQYAGRPLVAVWATAPYLHNNSVPTLYHLLLPVDQRPGSFSVGSREYDTEKLGFDWGPMGSPRFLFDTTKPGNSSAGHSGKEYGTELSEAERADLLEYLKGI